MSEEWVADAVTLVSVLRSMGLFDEIDKRRRAPLGAAVASRWEEITGEKPPTASVPKSTAGKAGWHDQKIYPASFAPEIETIVRNSLRRSTPDLIERTPMPDDVRQLIQAKAQSTPPHPAAFWWES